MNSTKPPLKFHNTLVNTISVHLKQHQRHLLDHGALAATLTPNFMIADTQLLINSQNLLNYNDFPIVVICITQYLTSLLCGFPQPGRPLGQPGSRIFSGKLLGAWNIYEQVHIKNIREQCSETSELITKAKEDPIFLPSMDKSGILLTIFGDVAFQDFSPKLLLPTGTDPERFYSFPLRIDELSSLQDKIVAAITAAATTVKFTEAGDNYFSSQYSTVLTYISTTLAKRRLEIDSELIKTDIFHLLLLFNFYHTLNALATADSNLSNLQNHEQIDDLTKHITGHIKRQTTKYIAHFYLSHLPDISVVQNETRSVMSVNSLFESLKDCKWTRPMFALVLVLFGYCGVGATYGVDTEIGKLSLPQLLSHFLLHKKPNLLTLDAASIQIPEAYSFVSGTSTSLPAANTTPTYQPPAPPNPPSSQHLSQATDLAANLSPVSQTPNSSLTTQSITQADVKHLRNVYVEAAAVTNAMLATEGATKVALTDEQFTKFNNNVNTTLKTTLLEWLQQSMPTADAIVESKIPATDSKKKPSDDDNLSVKFLRLEQKVDNISTKLNDNTTNFRDKLNSIEDSIARGLSVNGPLHSMVEALAKAAVEGNISEAENKLQEAFTTSVGKFLHNQKSSGLAAQISKNTRNIDNLSKCFNFSAQQTDVFVKAVNEALRKNLRGIFKGHKTVLKLIEQQPLMNNETVKLMDEFLTEFGFNFGPLPSPDASKEEQEAFDLVLTRDPSNTTQAAIDKDSTKSDNESEESKHNKGTPQKDKDDDGYNNPTPRGMDRNELNPHP